MGGWEFIEDGHVTYPRGFQAAGVACGIRPMGKPDLALIVSDRPAVADAVFTQNVFAAAPVQVSRRHVRRSPFLQAIVANSGIANAGTGREGLRDAQTMAEWTRQALGLERRETIVVASTGLIGPRLPMAKIRRGIAKAVQALSPHGGMDAAQAIRTTDRFPKVAGARLGVGGVEVRIGGIAKGAGMICPNMATMLAFLTTDAVIEREALAVAFRQAVETTFNRITVDGDTSTNDMVVVLANGMSGHEEMRLHTPAWVTFAEALRAVCQHLAEAIVRDGEGASRVLRIHVEGARSLEEARRLAYRVAHSPLVKTALAGGDPNVGRILAALGSAGVRFRPTEAEVWVGPYRVYAKGRLGSDPDERLKGLFRQATVDVRVRLRRGSACTTVLTSDLTEDYIRLNARYRT
ncbi:MAG: bifunctional glutamate N-acetyltransferase/amino-acid acetyltransferase ArgJ [Acidobacteria bacterium]|nr:bifunctional glutamate N-acetyltransferase/amino-acid acetyltransferase ArgJ [Acidobacteriota bacterium]MDW7983082.1 bifunctional glutamate N-acetyltransferase/amino-acid acetyltransferase ArgJ [Acidobacteriota bacterium]